jgi:hypothetical protein
MTKRQETSLALQQAAIAAYPGIEVLTAQLPTEIAQSQVDRLCFRGDSLARFIWDEVGDARGDIPEAVEMLETAQRQLQCVIDALNALHQSRFKS